MEKYLRLNQNEEFFPVNKFFVQLKELLNKRFDKYLFNVQDVLWLQHILPNGQIVILCPDIGLATVLLKARYEEWIVWIIIRHVHKNTHKKIIIIRHGNFTRNLI